MQPKFYADENVPLVVCKVLKQRGIDILTVHDVECVYLAYSAEELQGVVLFLPMTRS